MNFDIAQRLFRAFDPERALDADDDALYVPRTESVVDELLDLVKFSGSHRFVLVGAVRSGKSTELVRLYQRLRGDDRRATVLVDLVTYPSCRRLAAPC